MFRKSALAAALVLASGVSFSQAQDPVLDELYGRGVHRYFANDYLQAYDQLSLAINNGSQDPRAYYFRGFAALASGRLDEAEADWQTGAAIEAKGVYGGEIGRSLSRIQGSTRLDLERIRQAARLEAMALNQMKSRARYAPGADMPMVPLNNAAPAPIVPGASAAVPSNPFVDDSAPAAGAAKVDSTDALSGSLEAARPAPVEATPGEVATPAPADAGDGFGGEEPGADPFGGDAPSTDDPFGN